MELIAKNQQVFGQRAVFHMAAVAAFSLSALFGSHLQKVELKLIAIAFLIPQKFLQEWILFRSFIEGIYLQAAPHYGGKGGFSQAHVAGNGYQLGMISQILFQFTLCVYGLQGSFGLRQCDPFADSGAGYSQSQSFYLIRYQIYRTTLPYCLVHSFIRIYHQHRAVYVVGYKILIQVI